MPVLNCLIVEDEPLAAQVIADYIRQVPGLTLKGLCDDAFQAMELLHHEKIDLIFLDINLPRLSGLDFIKTARPGCHIILTTAYHQYALEGYELNVADYLLKPIEFNRFLQAVNKVLARKGEVLQAPPAGPTKPYFFNVDKTLVKVLAEDILYVEGLKDYVRIHTTGKKIVTKCRMNQLEALFTEKYFLRIHKSFIINAAQLTSYSAMLVEIGTTKLPIGRTYRTSTGDRLKALGYV